MFFFFSSRRRHTRCGRDWSSDVCSSDLRPAAARERRPRAGRGGGAVTRRRGTSRELPPLVVEYRGERLAGVDEVGRGPLVGAVVAAAVILDPARPIAGLTDSKALSARRREALDLEIREQT